MKNGKEKILNNNPLKISTVTVIGANGTMGAEISAIFASFGNAKVFMVCRSLDKAEKAMSKACKAVRADCIINNLIPADYSMLESCISQSDLVFESAAENLPLKLELTKSIATALRPNTIVCSGTSGLSITSLAECLPETLRGNYFGVHMFNPPYSMTLCELIPTKYSDHCVLEKLEDYLHNVLHRAVVKVKDSPAFLANRIGFHFINKALIYAESYHDYGGIDYIDAILGSFSGRSMSPITTADFVGLDVHKAIVDNIYNNTCDYSHDLFLLPQYVNELIHEKKLGRKTREGLYKSETNEDGKKKMKVYDIVKKEYRDVIKYVFPFAEDMKASIKFGDYKSAFQTLISNRSQEAGICLSFLLEYIVYSLFTAEQVGFDIHSADDAMATGFNWCPPLAMIDALSDVSDVKKLINERLVNPNLDEAVIERIFRDVTHSKYDYRSYFKSAR